MAKKAKAAKRAKAVKKARPAKKARRAGQAKIVRRVTAAKAKRPPKRTKPAKAAAKKGLSLHIGLNAVDPKHYSGWDGPLAACEFDANDMRDLAQMQKIAPTVLLTAEATRDKVLTEIRKAAKGLRSGDLFFLSYSGHGGQVEDVSGEEEDDKLDETWCLFDGQLIDDELYLELSKFTKGVRVLVLSDSCHSGTVVRARPEEGETAGRSRLMPPRIAMQVYKDHKSFYDGLQRRVALEARKSRVNPDAALAQVAVSNRLTTLAAACDASVLLISGCQDRQTSMDGNRNGAFTEQVIAVWNKGAFKGNYGKFHAKVKGNLPSTQQPNLFQIGPPGNFATEQPFSV